MDYIISKFNILSFPNIYDKETCFREKKLEKINLIIYGLHNFKV